MTSGKETVPGLSSHNAWTNPPCAVGDLVPPALRTSGLAGPVGGLSLWRPPWRDIPGRVRAGRGASRCADGLRGPATYGTGFSRDLGKPAQSPMPTMSAPRRMKMAPRRMLLYAPAGRSNILGAGEPETQSDLGDLRRHAMSLPFREARKVES